MPSMSVSCSGRPARIYGLYKLQPLPLQPNWTPSTFALCGGEQRLNTVFGPGHDTHTILQLPGVVQDQRSSATSRNSSQLRPGMSKCHVRPKCPQHCEGTACYRSTLQFRPAAEIGGCPLCTRYVHISPTSFSLPTTTWITFGSSTYRTVVFVSQVKQDNAALPNFFIALKSAPVIQILQATRR